MKMWIEDKYSPSDLNEIIAPYDMELKTQVPLWSEYLPFFIKYVDDLNIKMVVTRLVRLTS